MSDARIYIDLTLSGGNVKNFPSSENPRYSIDAAGVLTIETDRDGVRIYGPTGWWAIDVRTAVPGD
jgi:hypothetical protein